MRHNVGTIDKIARFTIAAIIAMLGILNHSWLGLLAIVPAATALIGYCPLYSVLGINTSHEGNQKTF